MQNAYSKRFATLVVGALLAVMFAVGTAVAPVKAFAAEPIDVALTVADNTTKTVYYNQKVSAFTTEDTVADLLEYAGFTKGSKAESAADSSVYFTNAYGVICFLGKGADVTGSYMWLNCLNGDSGYWDEVALNEKLQPNAHYQYVYDRSSCYLFDYGVYCQDPMPVVVEPEEPAQDEGILGLIPLPTFPTIAPANDEPEALTNPQPGSDLFQEQELDQDPAPADNGLQITGIEFTDVVYAGKYLKPAVTVADNQGNALVEGQDYTVSYSKNKLVGNATVSVQGMGTYEGTDTASFVIHPKATYVKKTSSTKTSIKVTCNKRTTQCTGYQIQVSKDKNFGTYKSSTSSSAKSVTCTIKNLKKHTKYYVKVRTYKKVDGVKVYSKWSSVKSVKTK